MSYVIVFLAYIHNKDTILLPISWICRNPDNASDPLYRPDPTGFCALWRRHMPLHVTVNRLLNCIVFMIIIPYQRWGQNFPFLCFSFWVKSYGILSEKSLVFFKHIIYEPQEFPPEATLVSWCRVVSFSCGFIWKRVSNHNY